MDDALKVDVCALMVLWVKTALCQCLAARAALTMGTARMVFVFVMQAGVVQTALTWFLASLQIAMAVVYAY